VPYVADELESTLQRFAQDVWIAQGPPVHAYGFAFDTRTIVVKLRSGDLWINSPVDSAELMRAVTHVGPVKYLVSPTPLHDWRLEQWHNHFPDAQCRTAKSLQDEPVREWTADLDQLVFRGNRILNEIYFLHRVSRTLIFGDFIQNHQPQAGHPVRNALLKAAGACGGVPIDIRLAFLGHKAEARASLEELLSWDFDKMILAHGDCVVHDAKAYVRRAFNWLL
jgi:hypothetical protein